MTDYDKIPGLNWSSLKHMATSPLLYKYRADNPEPRKAVFAMGLGIHCRVLEPEHFDERFALCTVRRNKRDTAYKEWLAEHGDKEPLSAAEMENVKGAAAAVLNHRVAADVLKGCRHEEPLTWDDPDTGLLCKGRVDAIYPAYIVDLKSARDPSPRKFTKDAADMMYHGQLAFYHTGATVSGKISRRMASQTWAICDECDGITDDCVHDVKREEAYEMPYIIAVAKEPPYDVAVYRMKPADLDAGRALCLSLMRKLEECIAADLWPGCAPDLQYLDMPPWAAGMQTDQEREW